MTYDRSMVADNTENYLEAKFNGLLYNDEVERKGIKIPHTICP